MTMTYDRRVADLKSEPPVEDVGELEVAEWIILLLAYDTYCRTIKEKTGIADPTDPVIQKGMNLLRMLNSLRGDEFKAFLMGHMPSDSMKKMLAKAFRLGTSRSGLPKQALQIRTVLSRGGAGTIRKVFKTNRAIQQVRAAMQSACIDDGPAALDKFAVVTVRNGRIRAWMDLAAKTAGSGTFQDVVSAASSATQDDTAALAEDSTRTSNGHPLSEDAHVAVALHQARLEIIQTQATEAAAKALEVSGIPDVPPTKSEVVGIATAVAAAIKTQDHVPETLAGLDAEQVDAAMTDGKVLVMASAGSGKTTTVTARVAYLVKERKVNPARIFVVSFNRKAARELRERIGARVGDDLLQQMNVGTMHGMFRKLVIENGTPEEKAALTSWLMSTPSKKAGDQNQRAARAPSPGAFYGYMARIWKECFNEDPPARSGNVVQSWIMNDVTPAQAKLEAGTKTERDQAEWYRWVQGFKGVDKTFQPPCTTSVQKASKQWGEFLAKWRDNGRARLTDFGDMLTMYRDLLKRDATVRKKVQGMFDHVCVDEAQDLNSCQSQIVSMMCEHIGDGSDGKSEWLVGDECQCIHEDTPISVAHDKCVAAKSLREGDRLLSYRNSQLVSQTVRHTKASSWTWGPKITTTSGKTLTMSPNHRIWANEINPELEQEIVYLMYRPDKGFRVGTTANGHTSAGRRTCVARMCMESADAIWFLETCATHEDALLSESTYSLQYGIPTCVFNGYWRDINQDRLDEVFRRFGNNGLRLLEDRHLDPLLPHWTCYAATRQGRQRRVIQMLAHNGKGTLITFEWTGTDLDDKIGTLANLQTTKQTIKGEVRRRVRKHCNSYREGLAFAMALRERTGALLNRRLSVPGEEPYQLINAAGLFVGMRVVVQDEHDPDDVATEEIVSIERVEGRFIDLDVDDASNFFGGGILSHNSVNRFVGARPELLTQFHGMPGWKTKTIKTNYRCLPEIVDHANQLMEKHPRGVPMEARVDPSKPRGHASIVLQEPATHAGGALGIVSQIKQDIDAGEPLENYAVLTRTNMEQNDYETACIIQGVPYARKGGTSFLRAPETLAVMSYFNLAVGQDFERMQKSLIEILNKPNRFYLRNGDSERIVNEAITKRARQQGVSSNSVNPLDLFDRDGVNDLMDAMDPGRRWENWKVRATAEEIENLGRSLHGMRDSVDAGKTRTRDGQEKPYTTQDLFGDILNVKGVPERRDAEPPTLRDVLMPPMGSHEEEGDAPDPDDDEAKKPVGNVVFLFQIAQPDPSNPDTDPSDPKKFKARIDKLVTASKDLRVDLDAWDHEQQKLPPSERKAPPCVTLSTIHSCKGAQWNNTTVVMAKGVFPYEPKPDPMEDTLPPEVQARRAKDREEDFKTERQLAYVALTRAAKSLTVVCPAQSVYGRPAGPSVFVSEAGLQLGQNVAGKNDPTPGSSEATTTVVSRFFGSSEDFREEEDFSFFAYDRRAS